MIEPPSVLSDPPSEDPEPLDSVGVGASEGVPLGEAESSPLEPPEGSPLTCDVSSDPLVDDEPE